MRRASAAFASLLVAAGTGPLAGEVRRFGLDVGGVADVAKAGCREIAGFAREAGSLDAPACGTTDDADGATGTADVDLRLDMMSCSLCG